jgi:hypothetical protein
MLERIKRYLDQHKVVYNRTVFLNELCKIVFWLAVVGMVWSR